MILRKAERETQPIIGKYSVIYRNQNRDSVRTFLEPCTEITRGSGAVPRGEAWQGVACVLKTPTMPSTVYKGGYGSFKKLP